MKNIRTDTIIFDEISEEEFETMSAKIIENNQIDYHTIQANAFSELGLNKKKRFSRKGVVITLIAAAIGVSAVSVGASGSFRDTFGKFFAGNSPDGVYSGKNLEVTSDNVNIEFLGICGNNHSAYASLLIRKKDGSRFVSEDFLKDRSHLAFNYDGNIIETTPDYDPDANMGYWVPGNGKDYNETWTVNCTSDPSAFNWDGYGYIDYQFEDTNTIRALISYNGDNLKDMTLQIRDKGLCAYRTEEIIFQSAQGNENHQMVCSDIIADLAKQYPKQWECFQKSYEADTLTDEELDNRDIFLREIKKAYQPLLQENQIVTMDITNISAISIVEKIKLPVDYQLSVKMNYLYTEQNLSIDPANVFTYAPSATEEYRFNIESVTADSFSLTLQVKALSGFESKDLYEIFYRQKQYDDYGWTSEEKPFIIEMKNGDTYELCRYNYTPCDTSGNDWSRVSYRFTYQSNDKIATLNPAEIKAIRFNDLTLYETK